MSDSNPKWLSVYLRAKWLWIQVSMLPLQTLRLVWERSSFRSSHPVVFLGKGFLKIYSKFTGEHPCRSVISIKLLYWNRTSAWVSPVNLLHIFRTPFLRTNLGGCFCSLTFRQLWIRFTLKRKCVIIKASFQHADFSASADFYVCADFSAYPHKNFYHNADTMRTVLQRSR